LKEYKEDLTGTPNLENFSEIVRSKFFGTPNKYVQNLQAAF
jgi:hypothetical protein